ncbi:RNB domain-containing ribonuclease [Streptomyces sp. PLK6-54]|uniref:RNB domain-containing ribonuclease n=2 Tax=Actinacidiphila acidipaludis TaxID=2873382 RepID=A0ABS7PZT6_9ACTN|nr:RNB domain-containing ribonuclease [Streptomyces acidipaludis]
MPGEFPAAVLAEAEAVSAAVTAADSKAAAASVTAAASADGVASEAASSQAASSQAVRTVSAPVVVPGPGAAAGPRHDREDATDLPPYTLDPPGSMDLDQAMHLARVPGGGYRVHYAIADVAAFVTPGRAIDAEAHRRVTTLYFPDARVPLHPPVLSEGAASLLPGQDRPALLWRLDLDGDGTVTAVDVRRALVRSRARLDYAGAQAAIDAGAAEEPVALLREIGTLREALEVARGGISLNVPEQEITERPHPGSPGVSDYVLSYRVPLPADGWNAQISLMTGMAGAELMLRSGTGILRTLPSAPDGSVARLRRVAHALGIAWPDGTPYAAVVRGLDPHRTAHAAFLQECTTLLRGAGYTVFRDGRIPEHTVHAAVAAAYTHCTAPLRRLVDRYAGELCVAAAADRPAPEWVTAALDVLPGRMAQGAARAAHVEHECLDLAEAAVELFDGYVVDLKEGAAGMVGTVHLDDPAVVGRIEAEPGGPRLPLGRRLRVRLTAADPGTAKVLFAPA